MEARRATHEALKGFVDEDEIVVSWVVVIETACADGARYLVHRAGGGIDGEDSPMAWTALGMMQAAVTLATEQVVTQTADVEDDEDEGEEA